MSSDLIWVALSLLVWGFGEGAFFSFQPLYLQQLGADPLKIGAILSAYGFAQTIAHIPAGYLADRIGRRPLMWTSWFIGAIATFLMALATTLPVFIAGMILYGATSFVVSPLNSYVTSARGRWTVGRALTIISASYNTGAVLGPIVGGWVGKNYGFRSIFMLAAVVFIVSILFILRIKSQPVETRTNLRSSDRLINNPAYMRCMGLVYFTMFATYMPQPLAPNFLQNERNLDLVQIGQLYSIAALGLVLTNLILGNMEHRLGYLIGQIAVGVFAWVLWQQTGMIWYGLAFLFVGGYRTARFLAMAQVQALVHPANMGLAYGISETISSSAMILVPIVAGVIYSRDPLIIFPVSIGLILASILINGYYLYFRVSAGKEAFTG